MKFVVVVAVSMLLPAAAFAQDTFCASAAACTTGISVTSATTIVGVGATMLTRIRKRKVAALEMYLRQNEIAVLNAAALGAGDVLADLAQLAGMRASHPQQIGRRLRARRDELTTAFERTDRGQLGALVLQIAEGT